MSTFKKLEDILAWPKARVFCRELKRIFPLFIQAKEFDLPNQLKSSAGSAMDNIAEGFGRRETMNLKTFSQFLMSQLCNQYPNYIDRMIGVLLLANNWIIIKELLKKRND